MTGARDGSAVPVASAAACREYVTGLLDRDASYDREPAGEPPLRAEDYRRALYVVLALDPDELSRAAAGSGAAAAGFVTRFVEGRRSFADEAVVAIAQAWSETLAARRSRRNRRGVAVECDVGGAG